jgi:hypothetical protein
MLYKKVKHFYFLKTRLKPNLVKSFLKLFCLLQDQLFEVSVVGNLIEISKLIKKKKKLARLSLCSKRLNAFDVPMKLFFF